MAVEECSDWRSKSAAKKPPQPINKGSPGSSLLAHIITSKLGDHLPLISKGEAQREGDRDEPAQFLPDVWKADNAAEPEM